MEVKLSKKFHDNRFKIREVTLLKAYRQGPCYGRDYRAYAQRREVSYIWIFWIATLKFMSCLFDLTVGLFNVNSKFTIPNTNRLIQQESDPKKRHVFLKIEKYSWSTQWRLLLRKTMYMCMYMYAIVYNLMLWPLPSCIYRGYQWYWRVLWFLYEGNI